MESTRGETRVGRGNGEHQLREVIRGIALDARDRLYVVGDRSLLVFERDGQFAQRLDTERPGHSVFVDEDGVVHVGEEGQVERFSADGTRLSPWRDAEHLGRVTALARAGDWFVMADAEARCLRRFDREGTYSGDIGADSRMKGFLIPNGVVDFAVDPAGRLRVVNPGRYRVECYTLDGELENSFGRFDPHDPAGFGGCCNPTNVAIGKDGIVVTEKAGPRVKLYGFDGSFVGVIAAADTFDPACKNMDVAVDSAGRVYVVDTVALAVRVLGPRPVAAGGNAEKDHD